MWAVCKGFSHWAAPESAEHPCTSSICPSGPQCEPGAEVLPHECGFSPSQCSQYTTQCPGGPVCAGVVTHTHKITVQGKVHICCRYCIPSFPSTTSPLQTRMCRIQMWMGKLLLLLFSCLKRGEGFVLSGTGVCKHTQVSPVTS